jgi:uncharacterized membrane protein YhaH (DUF805 family)
MPSERKRFWLRVLSHTLKGAAVAIWIAFIYSIATSGMPMIRQLLVCMLTTMAIFSLLTFVVKRIDASLKRLEQHLS